VTTGPRGSDRPGNVSGQLGRRCGSAIRAPAGMLELLRPGVMSALGVCMYQRLPGRLCTGSNNAGFAVR